MFGRLGLIVLGHALISVPAFADPLHNAVENGELEQVVSLIEAGADIEVKDDDGLTPLVLASLAGNDEIVEVLIARGADPQTRDAKGFTALHAAAHRGHASTVRMLLASGADVNDQENIASISPLHAASERGYVDVAEILLQDGANVNVKAGKGHTPIAMATLNTHPQMVRLLREHGGDCLVLKLERYRDYCLNADN